MERLRVPACRALNYSKHFPRHKIQRKSERDVTVSKKATALPPSLAPGWSSNFCTSEQILPRKLREYVSYQCRSGASYISHFPNPIRESVNAAPTYAVAASWRKILSAPSLFSFFFHLPISVRSSLRHSPREIRAKLGEK